MKCKHCGCTDHQACQGGCSWAALEICSKCASKAATVEAGQLWRDEFGQARVMAVAEGYAMLRRRRSNPFIASTDQMLSGQYGWRRVTP